MSKIGKQAITIPSSVTVTIDGANVEVKGPKGTLSYTLPRGITVSQTDTTVSISRKDDSDDQRAYHGLARMLINNMIVGVSTGWDKQLEMIGTGYRVAPQGQAISMSIGYSHPVVIQPPAGISFKLDGQTKIIVEGSDKQLVGQIAAKIRAVRPPEPYKGKGIRYIGEYVRRKAGKAATTK